MATHRHTPINNPLGASSNVSRRLFLGTLSVGALAFASARALGSGSAEAATTYSSFPVGATWTDTAGSSIQAHGGACLKVGSYYYWVGENKSDNSAIFSSISLYRSTDLLNWTFVRNILTKDSATALASCKVERPKLVYNAATHKYVLWGHWENSSDYSSSHLLVATCDTIDGSYAYQRHFRPGAGSVATSSVDPTYTGTDGLYGYGSRDFTIYQDPDSTTVYLISAENSTDMRVYQLTSDYQDVDWANSYALFVGKRREAPAMVKVGGYYFLLTSAQSGWYPNQCLYSYTTDPGSSTGWSALTPVGNNTTFFSQPANILAVATASGGTKYLYLGDRWKSSALGSSSYVWLPLTFSGTSVSMSYLPSWALNLSTGAITASSNTLRSQSRTVTASAATDTSHSGTVANDGDFFNLNTTGDSSAYYHPAATPFTWAVDLGAAYALGRIDIAWRSYNGSETYSGYTVEGSSDGATWSTIIDRTSNTTVGFTSDVLSGTYRYVRLSVSKVINDHNGNSATWAAGLVEVQIFS